MSKPKKHKPPVMLRPDQYSEGRRFSIIDAPYPEFIFSLNPSGAGLGVFAQGLDREGRLKGLVYMPLEEQTWHWAKEKAEKTLKGVDGASEVRFTPFGG